MKVLDVFPTPIYRESYDKNEELKQQIFSMMEGADVVKNTISDNLYHFDNSRGDSFLYREDFLSLKNWLEDECTKFVKDVMGYELLEKMIVTDSWLNICNTDGEQYPHYHTNSYISGTYYVNYEEGHAPLFFRHVDGSTHSPTQSISLQADKKKFGKYNSDVIVYPEEGEVLMWPSHITHGYGGNQKDHRISISMNFMPSIVSNDKYSYRVSASLNNTHTI